MKCWWWTRTRRVPESNLSEIPSEPWNGCDRLFIRDRAVTAAGMRWQLSLRRRKTEERERARMNECGEQKDCRAWWHCLLSDSSSARPREQWMPYTSMLIVRLVQHGTAAPSGVVPYSSIKTSAFIRNGDLTPGRQGDSLLIPALF